VFFESTHTINIKTFQKQIGQKKMDYSDTLVTFGTQNTGPRQVKPKKPQHNNTENTTWTQPTIGGRHLVVSK
jgi:hypothetical protein